MGLLNILLIDDHCLFSESLALAIKQFDEIDKLTVINTEQEFKCLQNKYGLDLFDIVLLDINLDKNFSSDGFDIAKKMIAKYPSIKIILLTGYDLPVYQYEAKRIGIKGFANKNIDCISLINIIKKIIEGGDHFSTNIVFADLLTEREKEILSLLGKGERRKNIAKTIYISERTLTNHIQNILEKLEVDSTIKAIIKAQKLGYIK
ncbi:response regulator transcription factor [Clostridium perfringens]|uniref:response regulator transcription factor n=1 Tax=Clostridium perfringens TaxID=1502 RepID=UPI001FAC6033|nr:response regulator transcription factor [Clostridium perfringens]